MRLAIAGKAIAASVTVAMAFLVGSTTVSAQEGPVGFTWTNATELSFVSTGGNASSSTLGLKSALIGVGGLNTFKLELGGVRGETDFVTRVATGDPTDFAIEKTSTSELTVENYFVRGRYDRSFTEAYAYTGTGWDRNTFAGIQNRYAFVVGVGRAWIENDSGHLKTDIGATYTIQKDVDPAPDSDDRFGGIRFSVDAARNLSDNAAFGSVLVVDQNVEETGDRRADWINSLSVSMSESLALKTSLQLLFDDQPSLVAVPLFDVGGTATGSNVLTPGEKWDSIITVALVISL